MVLQTVKASNFFTNMATGLFGRLSGGPGLAAVAASGAFGSIAPDAIGNAAATGVITIHLMKSIGFKPRFAAAVEAVASNGGRALPPVMGAIAFIMADYKGKLAQTCTHDPQSWCQCVCYFQERHWCKPDLTVIQHFW
jgi:TRAP-type uncharacterized transport system fused permease subunit